MKTYADYLAESMGLSSDGVGHCSHGHRLEEPNLYYAKSGKRRCKKCQLKHSEKYRLKHLTKQRQSAIL